MPSSPTAHRSPFYAELIRKGGEPALEIGCGTGHPLLDLVEQGLDVHGLDSSRDMLAKCEAKAEARDLRVRLYQQEMQGFALPTRYRTIFFAGASFMLLTEAQDSERTLHAKACAHRTGRRFACPNDIATTGRVSYGSPPFGTKSLSTARSFRPSNDRGCSAGTPRRSSGACCGRPVSRPTFSGRMAGL